ncbi:hypothetical protein QR680_012480 [Steinernema hermaphroditum]|uniref:Uncharacterized protein n=1 Tax=Steinernema hermaphroditum TaxID=289476 RepID=A0AA39M0K9_9BILA|nr:hypothetical protein QR680_012480 [Steinernema hermaphroditum]
MHFSEELSRKTKELLSAVGHVEHQLKMTVEATTTGFKVVKVFVETAKDTMGKLDKFIEFLKQNFDVIKYILYGVIVILAVLIVLGVQYRFCRMMRSDVVSNKTCSQNCRY